MSPAGHLLLNRRLIQAQVDAIDYVFTQELCHMAEPHHGAASFQFPKKVMPDWERRKQRLERAMAWVRRSCIGGQRGAGILVSLEPPRRCCACGDGGQERNDLVGLATTGRLNEPAKPADLLHHIPGQEYASGEGRLVRRPMIFESLII